MDGYATGTGAATMKDAFLGLKGDFGELRFGQNSGAGKTFGGKVENNYGATSFAEGGVLYNQIGGTKFRGGDRVKNSFLYTSPNFSGLTVNGLYSSYNNDNVATGTSTSDVKLQSRQTDLWLDYKHGPLFLNASLMAIKDPQLNGAKPGATCNTNNSNFCLKPAGAPGSGSVYNDTVISQKFAVAYTLPSATRFHALVDKSSYEVNTALLGGVKRDRNSWEAGILQDFGAHHVWLQYGKNSNYKDNGVEVSNTSAKYFNLGYSYDLSKEAIVRVYYAKVSNDSKVAYDFTSNPVSGALNNGASPQGIGVGVRYKF
jgi:predicted porin